MNHFPENVYYETSIPNDTFAPIPAAFSETRQMPFLEKPEKWEVCVPTFNLPLSGVPIFIFEENIDPAPVGSTIYATGYWITLVNATGTQVEQAVLYDPPQSVINLPSPYNFGIFNYNVFIAQINVALAFLWYATGDGLAEPVESSAPYIFFNADTALFQLVVPSEDPVGPTPYTWYNGDNNPSYHIIFNDALQNFFYFTSQNIANSQAVLSPPQNPRDNDILFGNMNFILAANNTYYPNVYNNFILPDPTPIPTTDVYVLNQEFSTMPEWFRYKRVVFTSATLPLYNKQVGDASASGSAQSFSILFDYGISNATPYNRSDLQYESNGQEKWVSMRESSDLRSIDVTVFLLGKDSNDTLPALIRTGKQFFITLWFKRKESSVRDEALRHVHEVFFDKISHLLEKLLRYKEKEHDDKNNEQHKAITGKGKEQLPAEGDKSLNYSYQLDFLQRHPRSRVNRGDMLTRFTR